MNNKSIDSYFESARQLPLAMDFKDVQALVDVNGIVHTAQKGWWTVKKIIMITTTVLVASLASVMLFSPKEIIEEKEKNNVQLLLTDTVESNKQQYEIKDTPKQESEPSVPEANKKEHSPSKKSQSKISSADSQLTQPATEIQTLAKVVDSMFLAVSNVEDTALNAQESTDLFAAQDTSKQTEVIDGEKKTIQQEVFVEGVKWLVLSNGHGNVEVTTWDKPMIQMNAEVTISCSSEKDAQKALEDLKLNLKQSGSKVMVENDWDKNGNDECSCNSVSIKIRTSGGERVKINKYSVDYQFYIPKGLNLDLKNRYGDIRLGDGTGDIKASAFKGNLIAKKADRLDASVKYGTLIMDEFHTGEVQLFKAEAQIGNSEQLDLNAKYSDVDIRRVTKLDVHGFKSDFNIVETVESVDGSVKYGDLVLVGDAKRVDLKMFQGELKAKKINDLDFDGSYSDIHVEHSEAINLDKSFQNDYTLGIVSSLVGHAQYSSFEIEALGQELDLQTFQGDIEIEEVNSNFRALNIESKYTPIELKFHPESKYQLNAVTMYTDVDYPKQAFNINYESRENQSRTLKGVFNSDSEKETSRVNVTAFQGSLELK